MGKRGALVEMTEVEVQWYCPNCNADVKSTDEVCPKCGVKFYPIDEPTEDYVKVSEEALKEEKKRRKRLKEEKPKDEKEEEKEPEVKKETKEEVEVKKKEKKEPSDWKPKEGTQKRRVYDELKSGTEDVNIIKILTSEYGFEEEKATVKLKGIKSELKRRGVL